MHKQLTMEQFPFIKSDDSFRDLRLSPVAFLGPPQARIFLWQSDFGVR